MALGERDLRIDISIVNGTFYDGEAIKLDYTRLDEPFSPYYPDIDDVRRVASSQVQRASVIEIPTQTVGRARLVGRLVPALARSGRAEALRSIVQLTKNGSIMLRAKATMNRLMESVGKRASSDGVPAFVTRDPFGFLSGTAKSDVIFDLSSGYHPLIFKRMADVCIERVESKSGLAVLVLENHTKDLQNDADFARIETVIEHIRNRHPHVEFRTLTEVAQQAVRLV